jgi:hypothetical protein
MTEQEFIKKCAVAGIPIEQLKKAYRRAMGAPKPSPMKNNTKIKAEPVLDYSENVESIKKAAFEIGLRDAISLLLQQDRK